MITTIIAHIFFNVKEIGKNNMKICAIICEYNPLHNGHLYQIDQAKKRTGADALLCLMSGNFVQRGEAAILDKFTRAKHAVLAGADIVIELPSIFATSNAELFAKGAIHLLSSIPAVNILCFGCEYPDKDLLQKAASLLNNEPADVSEEIKLLSHAGLSYAKARAQAWSKYIPSALLSSPNTILGIEYTRALLKAKATIDILPIQRVGSGYNAPLLQQEYSSATAIRKNLQEKENLRNYLPNFVLDSLPKTIENSLDLLEKYAILSTHKEDIAKICDCTEGLENAFQKAAKSSIGLVDSLTSSRYTSSRIRRIALQNLLNIEEIFIRDCLQKDLYLRLLGAKATSKEVLKTVGESNFPFIVRKADAEKLSAAAKKCFDIDLYAEQIYALLYPNATKRKTLFF